MMIKILLLQAETERLIMFINNLIDYADKEDIKEI